jgi:integral membrane sensor domain MASE1
MPVTLERVEAVLGFTFWSALVSPLLGATTGAGVVKLAFDVPYWPTWQMWWAADALGVLVIAPVVLIWSAARFAFAKPRPWGLVEGAAVFLGMVFAAEGVYGEWLPPPLRVPVFILPFLLWAGLRFGLPGATTAVLVVAGIGVWNTSQGRGPYTALTDNLREQVVRAQATLFVISFCLVALAAILAERQQAEQQRVRLIRELEKALAEIRTLRGLIPICAWCRKMRDDHGSWQCLEDYLPAHSDATLTHGICPECMKGQAVVWATPEPQAR